MAKKPSPKKRKKPNKKRKRQSRVKSRPRAQTRAEGTQDQAFGAGRATQSGDTQGLSDIADADSESVKELTEEGQYFEAEVVDGVENAGSGDSRPIKTKEIPEDDVPDEYRLPDREGQS